MLSLSSHYDLTPKPETERRGQPSQCQIIKHTSLPHQLVKPKPRGKCAEKALWFLNQVAKKKKKTCKGLFGSMWNLPPLLPTQAAEIR